jgi:hypothetical protein
MHGNYRAPTIIMPEEMVTPLDADNMKSMLGENLDEIFTCDFR